VSSIINELLAIIRIRAVERTPGMQSHVKDIVLLYYDVNCHVSDKDVSSMTSVLSFSLFT